ncbi:hypothetical protein ACHWQZ_G014730 [Mnemiopsis leidyi]
MQDHTHVLTQGAEPHNTATASAAPQGQDEKQPNTTFKTVLITDSILRHVQGSANVFGVNHELKVINKRDTSGLKEKKLNMSDDEYNRQVQIVIGGLLHRACPLTKSVLQQFDPSATRKVNASHLSSSKLKLESLEPCAEFLNIALADSESNKIYTKSTLAQRIVSALFALLPSNCSHCNEDYCVEFESKKPPILTCYKCFQESHNCETLLATYAPIVDIKLPTGLVWLCKGCTEEINPIVPRRSKSRHNSVSFQNDSKADLSHNTNSSSSNLQINEEDLVKQLGGTTKDRKTDICDKYRVGKCPHGNKGTRLVDSKPCTKSHPQKCYKYLRFGSKGAKSCKKGRDCKYFHPKLCPSSLKDKTCFNLECSFPHLKGTQRYPEKQRKRADSQQRSKRKADKPSKSAKPTPPTSENHFLELKKMVIQMTTKIQAMESRIDRYQMIPNLPTVPHHSFMSSPHNMSLLPPSQQIQAVPPAFYTPQFSS